MTDSRVRAATAKALKAMREESGLSQEDVAARVGTTQATISRWENGSRTPDAGDLMMLAAAYDSPEPLARLSSAINEAQAILRGK